MQVQVEKTAPCVAKLSVTVPKETVQQAFDSAYKTVAKQAKIPGFRQGKAPRNVIEKQYAEQLHQEAREHVLSASLYKAIGEAKIAPVAQPRVSLGVLARDSEFSYTAEVEFQPEITLNRYKGLNVPEEKIEVTDSEVSDYLENMRKQAAQLVPVMIRDTAQNGDVVLVDYEGTMGGVPFQGGSAQNALVELGAEGYIPGFAEGLVGAKVPGERVLPLEFPKDYSAQELAGKPATFKIKLKELKTKELPKLDDEFAKDLGEESFVSLEKKVRENLQQRKEQDAKSERRLKLMKALVEANTFDVPPSLIHSQTDRMIVSAAQRIQQMTGQQLRLNPEEIDKLRAETRPDAEFNVRSGILLLEVAKSEKIEVGKEEIETEIDKAVENAGQDAERARAYFSQEDNRRALHYRLLEDKTVEFLFTNSEA